MNCLQVTMTFFVLKIFVDRLAWYEYFNERMNYRLIMHYPEVNLILANGFLHQSNLTFKNN